MAWPDGVGQIVLDRVDSTNSEAARRAADLSGPTWILALDQTGARGRRGRTWLHPPGNFAATLVMQPTETPDIVALRSFVAALALFDALAMVTGRPAGLALKWPNDVLINGGKVAGILLESIGVARNVSHLAVGIGVNLADCPDHAALPPGANQPVSVLSETGCRVSEEEFLDALAPAFAYWEAKFRDFGFEPVRAEWLNRAARIGEVITARMEQDEVTGRFDTIDGTGAIVLKTAAGQRAIPAADIYFPGGSHAFGN